MSESPANQRHGDVWAQTLVVRLSSIETSARPSWIRFVLVIAAALSLDLVLIFIELGAKLSYAP
jgi:hypothetical protein